MPDDTRPTSHFELMRAIINVAGIAVVVAMIVVIVAAIAIGD